MELFEEIRLVKEKYKKKKKEKLDCFNIFDICNITYDEVTICRFLYEMLNPKGRHMQKEKYLKIFFEKVLNDIDMPTDDELQNAIVKREELIDNNRRIDISIFINSNRIKRYIPIEVKIYANDQENQCYDYYQYSLIKNESKKEYSKVYYLTPDGRYPSKYSIEKLNLKLDENANIVECEEIIPISFKDELNNFIDACIAESTYDNRYISEEQVLKQFKHVIDVIGGVMDNEKREIISKINLNKESFNVAKDIYNNFQYAINEKTALLFNEIYKRIEEFGFSHSNNWNNILQNNMCPRKTFPAIWKDIKLGNFDCKIFISIGSERPYYGLIYAEEKLNDNEIDMLIKYVTDNKLKLSEGRDGIFITWEYLPNSDEAPNFTKLNNSFYMLFNKDDGDVLINNCVDKIKKYLKTIESNNI